MSSLPPPATAPDELDEPGETMFSAPWESLPLENGRPERRLLMLIAGVAVLVLGWTALDRLVPRTPVPPAPIPSPSETLGAAPPASVTTTTVPEIVTEADLRAVNPLTIERRVMAFAETAAAEFFSADSDGVWSGVAFETSRPTFVERVRAVGVDESRSGTMRVLVAVSVLVGNDEGSFERWPPRGLVVEIDPVTDPLRVVGLPTPADLPFGSYRPSSGERTSPDPVVAQALAAWSPPFGTVDPESFEAIREDTGLLRVNLVVVDDSGNRWPLSVAINPDGLETEP
ncbi:MAG: hypothetical protein R3246_06715 [Acidimicrobiia bacterium]|nr:hypothetical protein [Acidimicrobiia bacterium]